jgi:hypothetical protein
VQLYDNLFIAICICEHFADLGQSGFRQEAGRFLLREGQKHDYEQQIPFR